MKRPSGDEYATNGSHLSLPELPPPAPRRSVWSLVFAGIFLMLACGVLVLLSFGAFGFMLAVAASLFLFVALHYFVWGRWLGDAIRREVAEEEAAEAARRAQTPAPQSRINF